jgi:hypothetical protein
MHLLPTTLGKLADLTEKYDGRFALSNVRLRVHGDNTFTAEATDTKCLLRVTGPCVASADQFPDCVPGLTTAPNGKTDALVPASAWKKTFGAAKKLTGRTRTPALRALAVAIGERVTTFGATDHTSHQCETVENGEGKFPPTDAILSQRESDLRARFSVDPLLLAELLRTVADTACDEETMRVDFEVRQPNQVVTIRAGRRDGVRAHAVIMPLTDGDDTPKDKGAGDAADENRDVIELEKRAGTLAAENEALRAVAADLSAEAIAAGTENTELREQVRTLKELLAARENRIAELTRTGPAPALVPSTRPLSRAERLGRLVGGVK